jgi:large subunit ribosomal protein L29
MNAKVEKIREASSEELLEQVKELKSELFNLRFQQATGQLQNAMVIGECKKKIARILTVLRQRELQKA